MSIDAEALARLREDYVLVPRRATQEMLEQFKRPPFAGLTLEDRYARMLAAAPETEQSALLDIAEAVARAPVATVQPNRGYMKDCNQCAPAPKELSGQNVYLVLSAPPACQHFWSVPDTAGIMVCAWCAATATAPIQYTTDTTAPSIVPCTGGGE